MTSTQYVIGDYIQVNMWKMSASGCVGSEGAGRLGEDENVQFWTGFSSRSVYFWSSEDYHMHAVINL